MRLFGVAIVIIIIVEGGIDLIDGIAFVVPVVQVVIIPG
jgi:hypothetical protein